VLSETCYDSICNNEEDCVYGKTDLPDCGGPCETCPSDEAPVVLNRINWALLFMLLMTLTFAAYIAKKSAPFFILFARKRKRKMYEQRLMLEAKVAESIFESLLKLESLLDTEDILKLITMFSSIVRRFFKSLLKLAYEFTYEELMAEIEAKQISPTFKSVLRKFFTRSTEIEFSGKAVTRLEMRAMISEFKQIVSFTSEHPFVEEDKKAELEKQMTKTDEMFTKIAQAEYSLRKGDINDAYFKYMAIVYDYKLLADKDRQRVNSFIARLYEEIKLAREKYDYEHQS
ncbi:MAG: hypothetical protein HGA85_08535, partial [Nanoarchaeota archaeon]|nr:hypothetical protein [Nanoarchaeota archaeon]